MRCLSSDRLRTTGRQRGVTLLVKIGARVLQGCVQLLSAIMSDRELSRPRIDFSKAEKASNRWDGTFTSIRLYEMQEMGSYRQLDRMFSFVAAFID